MKNLSPYIIILISTTLSSNGFADWVKVAKGLEGETFYIDFQKIKKKNGYVFFWNLSDYLKQASCFESDLGQDKYHETLSTKVYYKGDCRMLRYKILNYTWHKKPMGKGIGLSDNLPDKDWTHPPSSSSAETILKTICRFATNL